VLAEVRQLVEVLAQPGGLVGERQPAAVGGHVLVIDDVVRVGICRANDRRAALKSRINALAGAAWDDSKSHAASLGLTTEGN
jgi:hypothetical protein